MDKSEEQLALYEHERFFPESEGAEIKVMMVKNQQEKVMARMMGNLDIPFYLPLYRKKKRYQKSIAVHLIPLFSNYLFFHYSVDAHSKVLDLSNRYHNLVDIPLAEKGLFLKEIGSIRTLVQTQEIVEPYAHLGKGDLVRIKSGSFKGMEGIIVREKKRFLFVVNLTLLGRAVAAEIDAINLTQA